jgi:hypothetical protein
VLVQDSNYKIDVSPTTATVVTGKEGFL